MSDPQSDLLSDLLRSVPKPPVAPIMVNGQPFFGRVEEQNQFRTTLDALLRTPPGEHLPFVLLLYGDGGIGKTTLSRRFRDIIGTEYRDQFQILWVDWEDEQRRTARLQVGREHIGANELFDSLYAIAVRQSWKTQFAQYQSVLKVRSEAEQKAADVLASVGEKDEFAELRGLSATVIAKLVRWGAPVIGDVGENLARSFADAGIKGGAEGLKRVRDAATTRLKAKLDPDTLDIYLNPDERLAAALAEGFRNIADRKPLVVFLDTYEHVDRADDHLRNVMQAAGPHILWVIAGRDNLLRSRQFGDRYYHGYSEVWPRRLITYDMRQLARDDVRAYFATCVPQRPLDAATLDTISRATRGIPLAVREAAEIWKSGQSLEALVGDITDGTPTGAIVRHMTERYQLHCITNQTDRRLLYALALAEGDIDILRAMVQLIVGDVASLDNTLLRLERDYASVHREHARLHDAPAIFFLEYLKEPVRRTEPWLRQLIEQACTTLRTRLEQKQQSLPLLEERCTNEDWIKDALRLTDYLFWLDEEQAWRWLIPRFVESLTYSDELRRGLHKQAERWRRWMSKGGVKRLRLLHGSMPFVNTTDTELLNELARLARLQWLDGEGEAERKAILALGHGQLAVAQKHYAQAMQWYEQAEQGLPPNGEMLKKRLATGFEELGWNLGYQEDGSTYRPLPVDMAMQAYSKAIFLGQETGTCYRRLGKIHVKLGNFEDALQCLTKSIGINAEDSQNYIALGNFHQYRRRYEEAIAAYQQASDVYKQGIALDPQEATLHYNLGTAYQHLGRYAEAITAYQQAITLNPNYAYPHYNLGTAYQTLERFAEAITAYQQAIACDSKDADPHSGLGEVYQTLGRFVDAIAAYQQAIALNPNDAYPHNRLGDVYRNLGRYEEAIAAYQQAIARDPNDAYPHIGLGDVYNLLGRFEAALAACTRALELGSKSGWALYQRALAQRLIGDEEAATRDLDSAIALAQQDYQQRPHSWWNRFNLAIYTLVAGDPATAQQHYAAALRDDTARGYMSGAINDLRLLLQLFPGHPQAEVWRQRLQAHFDGGW
ncbi:peptidase S1 and S6 chymotrypsin/Hap [Oscillochloris trichoides DG-6]|uniref:Peptidase S1 and S6 chymotrypsin/Hap n=1 Tax=Oscillochloris trichoides DG-6 TaxID=765420 RepID=E1IFI1_9CHLR|nr:tetratricopeptide repeat protein [Oscillochloris trichoides]EFO80091.1 peptidase S1 and S6 chymotrypsin/Hap [Oscillochloris trichoides DG-6]